MTEYDVIIVGAGLSGLCAAKALKKQKNKILVLEAHLRTGGRIHTKTVDYQGLNNFYQFDMGANWINPLQSRIYQLAEELEVEFSNQPSFGQNILAYSMMTSGKQVNILYIAVIISIVNYIFPFMPVYNWIILMISLFFLFLAFPEGKKKFKIQQFEEFPPFGTSKNLQLQQVQADLDTLAININADYPWLSPAAYELDSLSLQDWAKKNIQNEEIYKLFCSTIECVFGVPLNDLSLLYVLYIIKTAGSVENIINSKTGYMHDRFVGGCHQLIKKLEQNLIECIKQDCHVIEIDDRQDTVYVKTDNKKGFKCKKVIVALPPHLAAGIKYTRNFPQERLDYLQNFKPNGVCKCWIFYERPFWRKMKLSGMAICPEYCVKMFFDGSPDTQSQRYGVLVGQMQYDQFYNQKNNKQAAQRKEQIIQQLVKIFGEEAKNPIYYTDENFYEDIFIRGNSCHLSKGIITKYRANLREKVGNIYWASSELSPIWNGYMEGAILQGERAADEIINKE